LRYRVPLARRLVTTSPALVISVVMRHAFFARPLAAIAFASPG